MVRPVVGPRIYVFLAGESAVTSIRSEDPGTYVGTVTLQLRDLDVTTLVF
jgi:hypothetical protein